MTETRGSVRQRKAKADKERAQQRETPTVEEVDTSEAEQITRSSMENKKKPPTATERTKGEDDDRDGYTPWLDVLRVLSFLVLASCGLSYLISGGDSFTWGIRHPPKYVQLEWWKSQLRGPLYLTPEQLSQYDGTDASKPIYLAINGTIYDVSANRRTYGPDGSYRFFAGADASRSYVTGCFAEDRTGDMRGVEEMFLPLDDPAIDSQFVRSDREFAALKAREREEALQKVHDGLLHWVNFFKNSPKYPRVGYVKRPKNWPQGEPRRKLCESAGKKRATRTLPST